MKGEDCCCSQQDETSLCIDVAGGWPRLVVSEFVFKESHLFVPVPHVLKQIKIADDVEDSKRSSTTDLGLTHQGSSGCCAAVTWPPRSAYAKHDLCQCAAKVTPGIGCEELWACAPEICCTLLSLWIEAERERECQQHRQHRAMASHGPDCRAFASAVCNIKPRELMPLHAVVLRDL